MCCTMHVSGCSDWNVHTKRLALDNSRTKAKLRLIPTIQLILTSGSKQANDKFPKLRFLKSKQQKNKQTNKQTIK